MKRILLLLLIMCGIAYGDSWIDNQTYFLGSSTRYNFNYTYNLTGEVGYIMDNELNLNHEHIFNISALGGACNVTILNLTSNLTAWWASCNANTTNSIGNFSVNQTLEINNVVNQTNMVPETDGSVKFNYSDFSEPKIFELYSATSTTTTTTTIAFNMTACYLNQTNVLQGESIKLSANISMGNYTLNYTYYLVNGTQYNLTGNNTLVWWTDIDTSGLLGNYTNITCWANDTSGALLGMNDSSLNVYTTTTSTTVAPATTIGALSHQIYGGRLIEVQIWCIFASLVLSIASLIWADKLFLPFLSGVFWLNAALGTLKVKLYMGLANTIDYIAYMDDWELIYIFGGFAVIMFVLGIWNATKKVEDVYNDEVINVG